MTIKINNNITINNNKKGEFTTVGVANYTTAQLKDLVVVGTAVGDMVFNSTTGTLSFWNGEFWTDAQPDSARFTFESAPGPSGLQGTTIDLQTQPNKKYIFPENGSYQINFEAAFPANFDIVGGGANGAGPDGSPAVVSGAAFILTAGGGQRGNNTTNLASFDLTPPNPTVELEPSDVPGTITLVNGITGSNGSFNAQYTSKNPGQPGQPGTSVYTGSLLSASQDGTPANGSGGQGVPPSGPCCAGGIGGASGAYINVVNHEVDNSEPYTITTGLNSRGNGVAIQSNL